MILKIVQSLGIKILAYRLWIVFQTRTGIMKIRFPGTFRLKEFISLEDFRKIQTFFFSDKDSLKFAKKPSQRLSSRLQEILHGQFPFFNGPPVHLGPDYNWITNPDNNYVYDIRKHFSQIDDFSSISGDIKFVWELSRFCWLMDIVRYDHHFGKDHAEYVFNKILDWIDKNPVNYGPNYKCSQEISIRLFNWTFVLFYYRNSIFLTQSILNKILSSIYLQCLHILKHINFSRIAVRNNHAITETFAIYFINSIFPFFPYSVKRMKKGLKLFAREINYQIFDDGSYLQHSMNYHRLVIQIITWAMRLSSLNQDGLREKIRSKAEKSLHFLLQFTDSKTGYLPNYGANDGSLIFRLNNGEYRDYRGQLNALSYALKEKIHFNSSDSLEDTQWIFNIPDIKKVSGKVVMPAIETFKISGYYIFRDGKFFLFIRCGQVRGRTGINDNLHFDLWYDHKNIFRDAGSYKYNTAEEYKKFFMGTRSHNTVMIEDYDQIERGPRFMSFGKSTVLKAGHQIQGDQYIFEGKITAFTHVKRDCIHLRKVSHILGSQTWIIEDTINYPGLKKQIWNYDNQYGNEFTISCQSGGEIVPAGRDKAYYSETYGNFIVQEQISFITKNHSLSTSIIFNN